MTLVFFGDRFSTTGMTLFCILLGAIAIGWNGVHFAEVARSAPKGGVGQVTGGTQFFTFMGALAGPALFGVLVAALGSYAIGFAAFALAPLALIFSSSSVVGLTYLLPIALLVTATLPITLSRVLRHRRITYETVLGALCAYVLIGLL